MKNKPTRHKESNTFKFQPFSERIANIDVDVYHRVGHKYENDSEESETYFQKALEKWRDLNLTERFEAFQKEVPATHTLPQLLQQKDDVVAVLIKYIKLNNPLCLQPVLELVVALARDLQHEFYPHYSEFVHNLIGLLHTKDTDVLEWTFTCLAYLSKFLWRYLVKDVRIVFTDLLPLLHDSRPDYINSFAAESFAFVARKVKDKKAFLLLVLKTLKKHPEGVAGCGRLLFEVVHGVAGQFHSCAAVMLPLVLEMLADKSVSQGLLFEVLGYMVVAMVKLIQPNKSGIFWTSAFKTVGSFVSIWEKDCLDSHEPICLLLKLVLQAVSYKNAVFVSDPVTVAQHIIELLKHQVAEDVLQVSSEIGAALLMSSVVTLPQEYATRIILKVLTVPYTSILLMFVQRVLTYPAFEVLVLPHLMYHCQSISSNNSVAGSAGIGQGFLNLLTRLVLHKAPLCRTGMDLKFWHQYPLDFRNGTCRRDSGTEIVSVPSQFLDVLCVNDISELLKGVEDFLCVTICLPHVKQLDQDVAIRQLKHVIILLCSSLKQTSNAVGSKSESDLSQNMQLESIYSQNEVDRSEGSLRIHLLVLATVLETVIHLTDNKLLKEVCNPDMLLDSLLPYACDPTNLSVLRALDLYFTACKLETEEGAYCLELLGRLHSELLQNLSSPFHEVRLLTLHVFSLFEQPRGSDGSVGIIGWPVFNLCLSAELVQPRVHEYRKKLQHLEKLEFTAIHAHLLKHPEYSKVPMYFLLGNLYINFQLLWEPTSKLIASYARGMNITEFWEVFAEKLHLTAQQIKGFNQETVPLLSLKCDFLLDFFSTLNQLDDKPDYINYRLLLWKAMLEFPDVSEKKNRDLSALFLTFLEQEYYKSNSEIAYSWSIKIRNLSLKEKEGDDVELMGAEEAMEDVELMAMKKEIKFPKSSHTSGREMLKTLLAHMNIFSKMKNPRSIYREPDLKKVYLDFLTHKNPEVQKMALDCLVSYKPKYLIPYREHLYSLIDDKTFKTELTVFRIDKESELIQTEHRTELMPFVMRILFSKMLTRTGVKSAASGQLRCSLVLRFLAGCHESEMFLFVEMAFKIYAKLIKDDPAAMVDSILESMDIEHIIPPKRLQSSLNLLGVILEKFGRLMGQRLLPYLLRVLFCISAIVQGALACRDMVHPGYLTTLLTLRNSCQGIAAHFFEHFDNYAWSEVEVDTVFRILVWPWLEKLPVEGIHSPTALLKLFLVWSKHPRYFVLLAKHADGNKGLSPLPYIMNLLLRTQTHRTVTTVVMELVERLLTLQDHQEEMTEDTDVAPDIPVQPKLQVDSEAVARLSLRENLNYGSSLLLPHISAILEYLEHKLGSGKHKSLGPRDLVILSRATELVWDASTSDTLLRLLLPLLGKKTHAGEETASHLITTLDNLFRYVTQPEKHIRSLAPLFGAVSTPGPRKLLNKLLITIAKCCSEEQKAHLFASAQLISKLNAFDAKWVEQPDFNQRLDGFKEVHDMLEKGQIDLELGVIIIHNCFHFIRTEKDLSLKDSAGYCLRKVAPAVCLKYQDVALDVKFLVSDTVLLLARAGIRDKNETVRQESIKLLGEMARECNELHPVLQDLSKLANKADPEVDFFENLLHLQSHRKSRALLKFCQVAKGVTKAPNPRTLTHFILPLASAYLCSEKYAHKNNIVDAAVETVGTVCRLLPWHQYETILRFYLAKLRYEIDFQKQLVRTVVAILDAFHFDLSKAQISAIQDKSENIEAGDVELMQVEVNDKKDVSVCSIPDPSGSVMTVPVNKSDEVSGETGILDSVKDNANKTIEGAGPEELVDRLESLLDLEDVVCKVQENECDATCEMASAPVPAVNRDTVLNKSVATHVILTMTTGLLPQIHRVMAQFTQEELSHKVNKKQPTLGKENEGILRVPIALAAVKLLQRLPSHMLDHNLPGILLKLCTFLKSRLESVRRVTRETLQKIILTLGPKYLGTLLHEMSMMLTRGYQLHVLIYTIHAVLVSLKNLFQPGDIDCSLQGILELCKKDLFGAIAEEKEVNQITGKLHEARKIKSYDTFQILAQFVTEKCLLDLIVPLREILLHSHSFKVIHKCSECLRRVVLGLADNTFVPVESLLVFMYGIASESIPDLTLRLKKEEITPAQKELLSRQCPDSFIIPQAPKNRSGFNITARTSTRTNAHLLVEFGLRLFHIVLKREKLHTGDFRPYIDPMVPILCDCFKAQHIKVTTVALHCMGWVLRMDLPALRENIQNVAALVFKLLHKYAAAGLSKGDNFDLVVAAFKVVAVLVRDVKYHVIGAEQMKTLLLYAEQDMYDFNRQATAFALLKAVLTRKLVAPEIHDIMNKVAKLSITSEFSHVRLQARQVFHQFLLDYPVGKKLEHHLAFYISQLNYEVQSGRESALEMVLSVIRSFPIDVLTAHSGLLFITLGAQLVNDDSPECRKMLAHCLKTMLERLDRDAHNQLFDIVIVWLKDKKVEHSRLAAQLCGIFVTVEKSDFENRLPKLFSLIVQQFNADFMDDNQPGRYVRIARSNDGNPAKVDKDERMGDHHLFQVLQLLLKICTFCPDILTASKWQDDLETVTENAQGLLAHPHEWIRLAAAQLLGHMFSSLNVNKVAAAVASSHHSVSRNECGYFYRESKQRLKSLVLDLCAQLQPHEVTAELVEQVVKDLVFLGRVLKNVSVEGQTDETEEQDSEEESDNQTKLSLLWMIRRMRKIVNVEIVKAPKSTAVRTAVFKWIGAIALDLGRDGLPPVAYQLLAPLSRELVRTDESDSGKQLCQLAKQVSDLIKKKLGMEVYMRHISRLQISLATRRADRKKLRTQQVLTDPEKASKRKIKKHLKKREVKKKRIERIKGQKLRNMKRKEIPIEDI